MNYTNLQACGFQGDSGCVHPWNGHQVFSLSLVLTCEELAFFVLNLLFFGCCFFFFFFGRGSSSIGLEMSIVFPGYKNSVLTPSFYNAFTVYHAFQKNWSRPRTKFYRYTAGQATSEPLQTTVKRWTSLNLYIFLIWNRQLVPTLSVLCSQKTLSMKVTKVQDFY